MTTDRRAYLLDILEAADVVADALPMVVLTHDVDTSWATLVALMASWPAEARDELRRTVTGEPRPHGRPRLRLVECDR